MFNTPILLITFNRPDHVRRVLSEIRKQQPSELYVCQDGPRDGNESDRIKVQEVRNVVNELVDWPCNLHTLYQEKNLGCGPGPATGISWFFDNVEMGMIFEDDCLPSQTLFQFYEELLNRYKNDERVSIVTGTNALSRWCSWKYDYLFSKKGGMTMGCWASWRRAWKWFDWEVKDWGKQETKDQLRKVVGEKEYYRWEKLMDKIHATPPRDAWDYQWAYARIVHNTCAIVSTVNQMSNIGFGADSTHTPNAGDRRGFMKIYPCKLPLRYHTFRTAHIFDWEMWQRFSRDTKKSVLLRVLMKFVDLLCRR